MLHHVRHVPVGLPRKEADVWDKKARRESREPGFTTEPGE